ncbi:ATP-binding cassette transporter [Favolaschia claudopus]|uniref:ATP-binding cassette transporter n=1 Tax=Favolaschia claudopus TaxID=2862362 RepID=A0AAW0E224_9AGAR
MESATPTSKSSTSETDSNFSSTTSNYALHTPSGVPSAQALTSSMKSMLESLDQTLEELHGQTMQIALLGDESQIAQDIKSLRAQLRDHELRQKNGIEEIKLILKNVESEVVPEYLKSRVAEEVALGIEQLIAEQVATCLKEHIPQDLQEEVTVQQVKILEEVRKDLHNSENRRGNAALRRDRADDNLQVIYKEDGTVPAAYPSSLQALFDMDAATSRALMEEYGMPDASDSRERNLNRLMQFLGVRYQMVREGSATRSVGLA